MFCSVICSFSLFLATDLVDQLIKVSIDSLKFSGSVLNGKENLIELNLYDLIWIGLDELFGSSEHMNTSIEHTSSRR